MRDRKKNTEIRKKEVNVYLSAGDMILYIESSEPSKIIKINKFNKFVERKLFAFPYNSKLSEKKNYSITNTIRIIQDFQ